MLYGEPGGEGKAWAESRDSTTPQPQHCHWATASPAEPAELQSWNTALKGAHHLPSGCRTLSFPSHYQGWLIWLFLVFIYFLNFPYKGLRSARHSLPVTAFWGHILCAEEDSSYKVIVINGMRGFQLQSIANTVRSIYITPISNTSLSTSHNKVEQRYSQH